MEGVKESFDPEARACLSLTYCSSRKFGNISWQKINYNDDHEMAKVACLFQVVF